MPNETEAKRYGATAQLLHWTIAALIVVQFSLAWSFDDLPNGTRKLKLIALHKSFGMTILMLAVLRLLWRLWHAPPPPPTGMTPLERRLARATHATLYTLIFVMPVTGWLMSSAKAYSVSWFNLFTWPNLIGKSQVAFEVLRTTHDVLSNVLLAIAVLHLLAAIKHHFWDRDDVLVRMLPFSRSARRS